MQVNQNIRFDRFLTDKIDQNKLNCIDCFQLSAAEQLCKRVPAAAGGTCAATAEQTHPANSSGYLRAGVSGATA